MTARAVASVAVAVPVRIGVPPKRRLGLARGGMLSLQQRRALILAMLADVEVALNDCTAADPVILISDLELPASQLKREPIRLRDNGLGLNEAVALAVDYCRAEGLAHLMILHADLPFVSGTALDELIAGHLAAGRAEKNRPLVTLVSDRHGEGSNILICSPPDALPFCYGPGSRKRHEALAGERGVRCRVILPVPPGRHSGRHGRVGRGRCSHCRDASGHRYHRRTAAAG